MGVGWGETPKAFLELQHWNVEINALREGSCQNSTLRLEEGKDHLIYLTSLRKEDDWSA